MKSKVSIESVRVERIPEKRERPPSVMGTGLDIEFRTAPSDIFTIVLRGSGPYDVEDMAAACLMAMRSLKPLETEHDEPKRDES